MGQEDIFLLYFGKYPFGKTMKKEILIGAAAGAAVMAVIVAVVLGAGLFRVTPGGKDIVGPDEAKVKFETALRDVLGVPAEIPVTVSDISEENGLFGAVVNIQGKDYPMFLSLDGKKLFPSALDTDAAPETAPEAEMPEIPKSARPDVRLFVMSYCPYGTQMQKGMLPVLEALGNKIDFRLQFVSYAMHDKKELDENLRQYCVQRDEPEKLSAYLSCFLETGQGTEAACLSKAGVNVSKNTSCIAETDKEFGVSKDYADKSTYQGNFPSFAVDQADNEAYGVQGSPTLVINGVSVPTERDPASILATVCSAFETVPDGCETELPSETPAPGFGDGTATARSDASCGN